MASPDNQLTLRMRAALRALERGEALPCGRPTRQRLVRLGLARWKPSTTAEEALAALLYPYERPIEITEQGRAALGSPRSRRSP